ncbi:MAG: MFS transporter [Prolixibacteraceae bacterium]|nr:MFS transporter [Prolixibacteraceae bacterium]
MVLAKKISNHNFKAFLWHAGFLAFAQNFMDVDIIIPAMVIESGGKAMHIGILTAIMLGGSSFTQLFFAPYISHVPFKKKYLIIGISTRILALFALGIILLYLRNNQSAAILWLIFLFITLFSLAGAFTNISYNDILGKSVLPAKRKSFFSAKQTIAGAIVLFSAFLATKVLAAFKFPTNFGAMFFIGAILLLIASVGFWNIKEIEPSGLKINGFKAFIRILSKELTINKKLTYFLGFINTQGIIISFLPFVMLYAKQTLHTQSSDTGSFLLFKVIGIVIISLLVFFISNKIRYNKLLYFNVFLSTVLIIATFLVNDQYLLRYIFVLGGITFSLYTITMNGLLLEVSTTENRAIYTGFAGAGNIFPALLPIIGGGIISVFGFNAFFILYLIIVFSSIFFIYKIDCKK